MRFAELSGVRAVVEVLPLDQVQSGYDRMVRNDARFRVVLTPATSD